MGIFDYFSNGFQLKLPPSSSFTVMRN